MILTTALLLILLAIKHFLFDFPFQTQEEIDHKGTLGDLRGISHSLKHAMSTYFIFLWFIPSMGAVFMLIELITHYFIDLTKVKLSKGLTSSDKKFWTLFGLDQLAHTMVYISMIALYFYLKS